MSSAAPSIVSETSGVGCLPGHHLLSVNELKLTVNWCTIYCQWTNWSWLSIGAPSIVCEPTGVRFHLVHHLLLVNQLESDFMWCIIYCLRNIGCRSRMSSGSPSIVCESDVIFCAIYCLQTNLSHMSSGAPSIVWEPTGVSKPANSLNTLSQMIWHLDT